MREEETSEPLWWIPVGVAVLTALVVGLAGLPQPSLILMIAATVGAWIVASWVLSIFRRSMPTRPRPDDRGNG